MHEHAGEWRVIVDGHWAALAAEELRRYEEEDAGFRRPRVLPPAAPLARAATAVFALALVLFALAQWGSALGLDWREAGIARASAIRAGELARTVTALTLHSDVPHLLSNLLFGSAFAYLLFHAHGGGAGALALVLAGALGNALNAWVHSEEHLSLGASTAVFAAVGLLAGSEWRARHLLREPQARRVAPVWGALLLLLYLGVGGTQASERVDVLAHLFGLLAGLVLGPLLGSLPRAAVESRALQLGCGVAAAATVAASWGVALALARGA